LTDTSDTEANLYHTQARNQTLPPSESDTVRIRHLVFDCKYLSCKICFTVLNYVFNLFKLIFTVW